MEGFHKLPSELLPIILENLPHRDLKSARLVCKSFRSSVNARVFFRHVSFKFPGKDEITSATSANLLQYSYEISELLEGPERERIFDKVVEEYMSIFQQLRLYAPLSHLRHITVHALALLHLTEALTQVESYNLSELTIVLGKAQFGDHLIGKMIRNIDGRSSRVFLNVKNLTVIGKDFLPYSSSSPFSGLFPFAGRHTSNIENLGMRTGLEEFLLHHHDHLGFHRFAVYNWQSWNSLRKIHLTSFIVDILSFANLIHSQPFLEVVLLERINVAKPPLSIPAQFNESAWKWFFTEFGKVDNTFFRKEVVLRPETWAKTRFYVDQLMTEMVYEDIDSWDFQNVMKLTDYVEDEAE